jgi:hypothetical protein
MGRFAQSAWIIPVFAVAVGALAPAHVHAAATAQGVALSATAGCNRGDLDITLTTADAHIDSWLATNLAGATLVQDQAATVGLATFTGTWSPYLIGRTGFLIGQLPGTLVGSYASVGETPPDASNTAEFFVFYNCSTRQVLYSCYGAYGSCPQTAQAAAALVAPPGVPALDRSALLLTVLVLAAAGGLALRHRSL